MPGRLPFLGVKRPFLVPSSLSSLLLLEERELTSKRCLSGGALRVVQTGGWFSSAAFKRHAVAGK